MKAVEERERVEGKEKFLQPFQATLDATCLPLLPLLPFFSFVSHAK